MLRPETYYSELATNYPNSVSYLRPSKEKARRKQVADQAAEIDSLVAALVPEETSPNKRAIVRHLVACWFDEQSRKAIG